jgi:hypothetical protein
VSHPGAARPTRTRRRVFLAGAAVAAAYLLVAAASFWGGLLPRAPVLDGLGPPPPYQWVSPPPGLTKVNKPPSGGTSSVPFVNGVAAGSVTTPDGQCEVLFGNNAVPALAGQTSVQVTMTPVDPNQIGPPPSDYAYDANAYKITAAYEPSGTPITTWNVTVVLSYATAATAIIQRTGSSWTALASTPSGYNQLFAPATGTGIFSAEVLGAGAGSGSSSSSSSSTSSATLIVVIVVIFAVVLGLLVAVLGLVRARHKAARQAGGGRPPGSGPGSRPGSGPGLGPGRRPPGR